MVNKLFLCKNCENTFAKFEFYLSESQAWLQHILLGIFHNIFQKQTKKDLKNQNKEKPP